ncbi:hypothetical protein RM844_28585 [Streptomyces sp. DSM 44915]|uniref:Uncharacterized protein n=1 Tax=Streptomyces chisholmiae TaxID=3075540 RepID=A0ABU2JZQ6_9ACTN|nr:hypothetical protein [Streptomyces sp. DSM 44915]MDT0270234.1 hypothetical protein [Streptomyces sp. DSM 44915]
MSGPNQMPEGLRELLDAVHEVLDVPVHVRAEDETVAHRLRYTRVVIAREALRRALADERPGPAGWAADAAAARAMAAEYPVTYAVWPELPGGDL